MKKMLIVLAVLTMWPPSFAQVTTEYQAKNVLNDLGVYSSKIIRNAESIIIKPGEIKGLGGICTDLPILDFINENQVVLLPGVSGSVTNKGIIIIEADRLYVCGIVYSTRGKKYFIVGPSLRDIVNSLIR